MRPGRAQHGEYGRRELGWGRTSEGALAQGRLLRSGGPGRFPLFGVRSNLLGRRLPAPRPAQVPALGSAPCVRLPALHPQLGRFSVFVACAGDGTFPRVCSSLHPGSGRGDGPRWFRTGGLSLSCCRTKETWTCVACRVPSGVRHGNSKQGFIDGPGRARPNTGCVREKLRPSVFTDTAC